MLTYYLVMGGLLALVIFIGGIHPEVLKQMLFRDTQRRR